MKARLKSTGEIIEVECVFYGKPDGSPFIPSGEIEIIQQSPWISVEMAIPKETAEGTIMVRNIEGKEWEMAAQKVSYWIYPYIKSGYVTHWRVSNE